VNIFLIPFIGIITKTIRLYTIILRISIYPFIMNENIISIRIINVTRTLGTITIFLAFASFIRLFIRYQVIQSQYLTVLELFNMDAEKNIPTFFYVLLLICCSLLLASISLLMAQQKSSQRNFWLILTFLFLTLSLEKAVRPQEYLLPPLMELLKNENISYIKYFPIIIALLFYLGIIVYSFMFVQKLPTITKRSFIIATCIYIIGAFVLDMVGSIFYDISGQHNIIYSILGVIEESVEMIGIIAFIHTFLNFIRTEFTPLMILIEEK